MVHSFILHQVDPKRSKLKLCTGCRKISYCSKECQEEHWRKVHRQHCKIFSGRRKNSNDKGGVHNKETCSECIMQKAAGQAVFKEKNPNYICVLSSTNPKAKPLLELQQKYPLPLAGIGEKRPERFIDILQKLLLKIKLSKQPVSWMYPTELKDVEDELCRLKRREFSDRAILPSNYYTHTELGELKAMLTPDLKDVSPSGPFQMWQTFVMLFELLYCVRTVELDGMIKNPEKSLPKEERRMSRKVRASSFLKLIDKMLDALDKQVVSQKDLANIVCEDNVLRACIVCNIEITIQAVSTWGEQRIPGTPSVMFHPGLDNLFCCGAKVCAAQMDLPQEAHAYHFAVIAAGNQLRPTRCDFCFLFAPPHKVHR